MTVRAPRPRGRTVNLTTRYACPCGRERAVLIHRLDTSLPIGDAWRPTGACPKCGRGGRWRIETRADHYLIHVQPEGRDHAERNR